MDPISNKASKNTRKTRPSTQDQTPTIPKQATQLQKTPQIQYQKVQFIQIDTDHSGRRIDNFLFQFFKGVPKGRIYKMLRKGEVRANKKRVAANYRLQEDDELRLPPVFLTEKAELNIPHRIIEELKANILFEDEALLIINKPSGIPVHAGSGFNFGVIEALRASDQFKNAYIELAHRLDRETSGCLVLVKQAPVLRQMNQLIKSQAMDKRYITLVKGIWQDGDQDINLPLLKTTVNGERIMRVDAEQGKAARTVFSLRQAFTETSLLDVILHSGRTHQIRVHAQSLNMPVAGDSKYGDDRFNQQMKTRGLRHLFLHASQLSFQLEGRARVSVQAPLPNDLQAVIKELQKTA